VGRKILDIAKRVSLDPLTFSLEDGSSRFLNASLLTAKRHIPEDPDLNS
jgi:hypothetical protein